MSDLFGNHIVGFSTRWLKLGQPSLSPQQFSTHQTLLVWRYVDRQYAILRHTTKTIEFVLKLMMTTSKAKVLNLEDCSCVFFSFSSILN